MTNQPEDDAREPVILPGGESADSGATPAVDAAAEQTTAYWSPQTNLEANDEANFDADRVETAQSAPVYSYIPPESIPAASIPPAGPPPSSFDRPLFYSYSEPPARRFVRIPNFGHLLLLSLLITVAFSILIIALALATHFHLFGFRLSQKSATDLGFNLVSEVILYLGTFGLSLFVFPMVWNESLFAGLQWRGRVALSKFKPLVWTAAGCFGLAILDQVVMPGPANSPIEKMISSPGAAWMMFAFGVTMAPFFEEMFFRGFLLPSLCTACDWIVEKFTAEQAEIPDANVRPSRNIGAHVVAFLIMSVPLWAFCPRPAGHYIERIALVIVWGAGMALWWAMTSGRTTITSGSTSLLDSNGHPKWSVSAMISGSILTSLPFALLHVDQQGRSLGPFLLLIVVSLILCAVRLKMKSLAASTLVHASYNFFIFSLMLAVTGGFRHFDKI